MEKIIFSNPILINHFSDRPSIKKWISAFRANLTKLKIQAADDFIREVTKDDISFLTKFFNKNIFFQNFNPNKILNCKIEDLSKDCFSNISLYRRGDEVFVTTWR